MSQTAVIKVTSATMQKLATFYAKSRLNKAVPYTEFVAKVQQTTITAYTSGKVVFQGPQAQTLAEKWGTPTTAKKGNTTTAAKKKQTGSALPANLDQLSLIGSDEVGNGSYFGPVTVCAAYVENQMIRKLQVLGVKDSKELTDPQIRQLATQLKQLIPHRLLVVSPQKYNEIQPKYNAVHMKVVLHNQAIRLLLEDLAPSKPEGILIDQFTPEANYRKYVKNEAKQVQEPLWFATKAEQYHVAVAAASIISRAAFLEALDEESAELGLTVPSGAGAKADHVAAQVLRKGGLPLLRQYAKLHFANTQKAQALVANTH